MENERKEFVAYLNRELKSLRYQPTSNALVTAFAGGKPVYKDQGETKIHFVDEIPEVNEVIDPLGQILQLVRLKIPKSPTLRDLEIQEEEGSILHKLDEEVMETLKGILKEIG